MMLLDACGCLPRNESRLTFAVAALKLMEYSFVSLVFCLLKELTMADC